MNEPATLLCDPQNDVLHADGACGPAGRMSAAIAALPACFAPLARRVRAAGGLVIFTHFTLIAGRDGNIQKV